MNDFKTTANAAGYYVYWYEWKPKCFWASNFYGSEKDFDTVEEAYEDCCVFLKLVYH